MSFALYLLHLPPNFSVHMKSEDVIYCCLQEFCVIPSYLLVLFNFFSFLSSISVGFSLFDIHFLVFLSIVVILSWFASLCWLFTLSFHSCFSLLPLFCLVFPLTSFILLSIEILLKAKFWKSLPVFVGIACFALNLVDLRKLNENRGAHRDAWWHQYTTCPAEEMPGAYQDCRWPPK